MLFSHEWLLRTRHLTIFAARSSAMNRWYCEKIFVYYFFPILFSLPDSDYAAGLMSFTAIHVILSFAFMIHEIISTQDVNTAQYLLGCDWLAGGALALMELQFPSRSYAICQCRQCDSSKCLNRKCKSSDERTKPIKRTAQFCALFLFYAFPFLAASVAIWH